MYIFEFHVTSGNLERFEIDELVVASRYYRCSLEMQKMLMDIATGGRAVVEQKGVMKGADVIEALTSSPFILKNDFEIICQPLFSDIRTIDGDILITGSNTPFYTILKALHNQYDIPQVSLKNQSSSRFFFYWIKKKRPGKMTLLYKEVREILELKKGNYKAFVHYSRVLSTVKTEMELLGIEMTFNKYPSDASRASGVEIEMIMTNAYKVKSYNQ